jgi:hypothetical protein
VGGKGAWGEGTGNLTAVSGDAIIRVIIAKARKPVSASIMMIFDAVRLENYQASGNF